MHAKIYIHKCLFFSFPVSSFWTQPHLVDIITQTLIGTYVTFILLWFMTRKRTVILCWCAFRVPLLFICPFLSQISFVIFVLRWIEMNHCRNAHRISLILFYSCLQIKCPLKAMPEECVWVARVWPKHSSAHMILVFRKVCVRRKTHLCVCVSGWSWSKWC